MGYSVKRYHFISFAIISFSLCIFLLPFHFAHGAKRKRIPKEKELSSTSSTASIKKSNKKEVYSDEEGDGNTNSADEKHLGKQEEKQEEKYEEKHSAVDISK